ncbi:hypothetical protein PR048_005111 [Dryococelus australis]|uniref:Uncharacterized protein n=1 Tax=Dryococelus australis TaxID=614101 RepID=A0ABQ9I796_9NEOP|nr:hypothetical protein PR048_005111 [Dryococelus australis]
MQYRLWKTQLPGETVTDLITALHNLPATFEYRTLKQELIHDRMVVVMSNVKTSVQLQLLPELTLEQEIIVAKQAKLQSSQSAMLQQEPHHHLEVHRFSLQRDSNSLQRNTCSCMLPQVPNFHNLMDKQKVQCKLQRESYPKKQTLILGCWCIQPHHWHLVFHQENCCLEGNCELLYHRKVLHCNHLGTHPAFSNFEHVTSISKRYPRGIIMLCMGCMNWLHYTQQHMFVSLTYIENWFRSYVVATGIWNVSKIRKQLVAVWNTEADEWVRRLVQGKIMVLEYHGRHQAGVKSLLSRGHQLHRGHKLQALHKKNSKDSRMIKDHGQMGPQLHTRLEVEDESSHEDP